jgi:hypothetical protein
MSKFAHAISDDKAQLLAITEFNYYPNRYIHSSWVDRLENSKVIRKLLNNARSEDNVAEYLLERFNLKDKLCFDFDTPIRQLALLPKSNIMTLVMYAGAMLNSHHARHAIHRDDVIALNKGFGDELFDFALNQAPLLFDLDVLPKIARPAPGADVQAHLAASGLYCLGKALSNEPAAITERVYLKMGTAEYPFLEQQPAVFKQPACEAVFTKLMKLKNA